MFVEKRNKLNLRLLMSTRKSLAIAISLATAGTLILFFASYPQISNITNTNRKLKQENDRLDKLVKKSFELEQVKLLPEFSQADKVEKVLPSHKPLLELLTHLNQIASKTEVSITQFEISPGSIATDSTQVAVKTATNFNKLELNLTVNGPLKKVEEFMSLIEKISPITTITDLSLSRRSDEKTGEIMTKADLTINAHYFTQSIRTTLESALPKIGQKEKDVFKSIQDFTPSDLDVQTEIQGGGSIDFFDVNKLDLSDSENSDTDSTDTNSKTNTSDSLLN